MSYTFTALTPESPVSRKEEPCLCAQGAECFSDSFQNGITEAHRVELAGEAWSECLQCKGTGVETVEYDERPSLNLNNENAKLLLGALGLSTDCWGEMTLPEARRGLMRARARKSLSEFTRASETFYGAPRADENGAIELRPFRGHSGGFSEESLRDRIERFALLVDQAAEQGATKIFWS